VIVIGAPGIKGCIAVWTLIITVQVLIDCHFIFTHPTKNCLWIKFFLGPS